MLRTGHVFIRITLGIAAATIWGCSKDPVVAPPAPSATVRITSPQEDSPVFGTVSILVEVVSRTSVSQVELFVDAQTDSTRILTSDPYVFTWTVPEEEDSTAHTLQAQARFSDNTIELSPLVTVISFRLAPSDLRIDSINEDTVIISWRDNSVYETGFQIERAVQDSAFILLDSVAANSTSRVVIGPFLTNTDYSFRVRAISDSGFSIYSNSVTAMIPFPAPYISSVGFVSDSSVQLVWEDTSDITKSFDIERSTDGANFSLLATVAAGTGSTHDTTLSDNYVLGQYYHFRVRSRSIRNLSPFSNVAGTEVPFPAPTGLKLASSTQSEVTLSWVVESRFTQMVRLEKQMDNQGFSEVALLDVNDTTFTDPEIDPEHTYQYRVQALSDGFASEYSPALNVRYTSFGGFQLVRTMYHSFQSAGRVAFSASDQILVSSGRDAIRLWDTNTGNLIRSIYVDPTIFAAAPPMSTTEQYVAVRDGHHSIRVHDVNTGQQITTLAHNSITAIEFSPDGQFLAAAGPGASFSVWQVSDWSKLYEESDYAMYDITFSSTSKFVAAGSNQYYGYLYEADSGTRIWNRQGSHYSPVWAVAISPDEQSLALGGSQGTVYLWRISDGTLQSQMPYQRGIYCLTFSPDGEAVLAGGFDSKVYVWSGNTLVTTVSEPSDVLGLAYSRDGRYLATANDDRGVRLYLAGGWAGTQ